VHKHAFRACTCWNIKIAQIVRLKILQLGHWKCIKHWPTKSTEKPNQVCSMSLNGVFLWRNKCYPVNVFPDLINLYAFKCLWLIICKLFWFYSCLFSITTVESLITASVWSVPRSGFHLMCQHIVHKTSTALIKDTLFSLVKTICVVTVPCLCSYN